MKTSLIAIRCGYVENAKISWLFFESFNIFDTGLEALEDLAGALICSIYGENYKGLFDIETFTERICEIHNLTNDEFGYDLEYRNWWLWPSLSDILTIPKNEILCLDENAEHDLVAALKGNELNNESYKKAIKEYWENVNITEWNLEHGWDGTRESFGKQLDKYPYRII